MGTDEVAIYLRDVWAQRVDPGGAECEVVDPCEYRSQDLTSGSGVANTGQAHSVIVTAIQHQSATFVPVRVDRDHHAQLGRLAVRSAAEMDPSTAIAQAPTVLWSVCDCSKAAQVRQISADFDWLFTDGRSANGRYS